MKAYEEIVEFIAGGPSVRSVADFQASPEAQARVQRVEVKKKAQSQARREETRGTYLLFANASHVKSIRSVNARLTGWTDSGRNP